MNSLKKGFGLIELMITMVIVTVVMVMVYKYWIQSVKKMTDVVALSSLKRNTSSIFETVTNDLKLIGYNPTNEVDATNHPLFAITHHPSPYDSLTYSAFNPDPLCTKTIWNASCGGSSNPPVVSCTCTRYWVDSDRNLVKSYFDFNATPNTQDQILARNACVRFLYCNTTTNSSCADQDGDPAPTMIKLILAVAPDTNAAANFSATGCLDSDPATPCCEIPGLGPTEYIRFEKNVYLTNIN